MDLLTTLDDQAARLMEESFSRLMAGGASPVATQHAGTDGLLRKPVT